MLSKEQIELIMNRRTNRKRASMKEALSELNCQIPDGTFVYCVSHVQFLDFQRVLGRKLKFARDEESVRGQQIDILIVLAGTIRYIGQKETLEHILVYSRVKTVWRIYDW